MGANSYVSARVVARQYPGDDVILAFMAEEIKRKEFYRLTYGDLLVAIGLVWDRACDTWKLLLQEVLDRDDLHESEEKLESIVISLLRTVDLCTLRFYTRDFPETLRAKMYSLCIKSREDDNG